MGRCEGEHDGPAGGRHPADRLQLLQPVGLAQGRPLVVVGPVGPAGHGLPEGGDVGASHGGQGGAGVAGRHDVVPAGHGHVVGDPEAEVLGGQQGGQGPLVVAADDRVGAVGRGQQGGGRRPGRRLAGEAGDRLGGRQPAAVEHGTDPGPALLDVEGVAGVAEEGEPVVAVAEEVLGQPLGAGGVLGGDGVGALDLGPPGQQHDREPAGHDRADRVPADGGVEDGQAVDPGGELADGGVGVGLLAGGEDEHAPAQPGRDLLIAEHDLGERRAGQVGEHHPVGGVAALGQGDAEAAGDEAQLVDRVLDPPAGPVLHRGRAAQDPRDGGDRHPGPAGDVVNGGRHPGKRFRSLVL